MHDSGILQFSVNSAVVNGTVRFPCLLHCLYLIVICHSLNKVANGILTCSLGDDGFPSYEDTCSFTCNTGYELLGSDTRTCQSDGSWSGKETNCRRGESFLLCMHLYASIRSQVKSLYNTSCISRLTVVSRMTKSLHSACP